MGAGQHVLKFSLFCLENMLRTLVFDQNSFIGCSVLLVMIAHLFLKLYSLLSTSTDLYSAIVSWFFSFLKLTD